MRRFGLGRSLDYTVVRQHPLVVTGVATDSARAQRLQQRLATDHPDTTFVGIITSKDIDELPEVLAALRPSLSEMIFTEGPSSAHLPGASLADIALNQFGVGQDFVFTVPLLDDAIRYAIARLTEDADQWDGTAVLVPGSRSVVKAARKHRT